MSTSTSSASQRIDALLDEKSFVEIGAMITARATDFSLKQNDTPSDGVITGYGTIDGNRVYVYSQDASVLGGSIGEMHARKIANLYDLAMKTGTPVIGLIESAGLRLQESTDALNALGEIFFKQSMAQGVIPQITAVFGSCGGGLAISTALSDFTFMEIKNGKLFVNSPNALEGNYTEKDDTSSAKFQAQESGNIDFAGTEDEVLEKIREVISIIPQNNEDYAVAECTDELNRAVDVAGAVGDTSIIISNIADDNNFVEMKEAFAKDMVTGFIRLDGVTVGVIANRSEIIGEDGKVSEKFDTVLSPDGCRKATEFVYFCDSFGVPVITITNTTGFKATKCSEKKIAKAVAEMTQAFANCDVPRINLIVGKAFGSAYVAMNSKAIGADQIGRAHV